MALPTNADLKLVLRIQTTGEDTFLTALVARAQAACEAFLDRPITAASSTWTDWVDSGRYPAVVDRLVIPVRPFTPAGLSITDADGVTLSSTTDYYVPTSGWDAVVRARPGVRFTNGPYTLTASAGLSTDARYSTLIEPAIAAAILDTAADLYRRRLAAAAQESSGGGVAVAYVDTGLTERAKELLAPWKAIAA